MRRPPTRTAINRLLVGALMLVALAAAGCNSAGPNVSAHAGSGASPVVAASAEPSPAEGSPSATAAPRGSEQPTTEAPAAVVPPPAGLLPPGSLARVTADGLRVRAGPPGTPEHQQVISTLNAGDLVLVDWSPLAYIPASESDDGRGWYSIHVGGAQPTSYIDGGVNGWVAEGSEGLEYFEVEPPQCSAERDLEHLIFPIFTPGAEQLGTPWERLACRGDRRLELTGVFEYLCPEGGVYPYRFDPVIAAPNWCTGLLIDAFDSSGNAQYGSALVVRFPAFTPSDLARGDVLRVGGHFDDPAASSCSAETEPGFEGRAVDVPFLVLFCREQFVPDEWELLDHRELGPLPWES